MGMLEALLWLIALITKRIIQASTPEETRVRLNKHISWLKKEKVRCVIKAVRNEGDREYLNRRAASCNALVNVLQNELQIRA